MTATPNFCPTCKRPIDNDPSYVFLSPIKKRIFEFVKQNPGTNVQQIMDCVYGHLASGGPQSLNVISVHISGINKQIKHTCWRIKSNGGPGSTYWLEKLRDNYG